MTTISAWGKPGAWALEAEEQEAIEMSQSSGESAEGAVAGGGAVSQRLLAEFPSLEAAAASKSTRKKKGQTLSLSEFTIGQQVTHGAARAQPRVAGLTPNELLVLPTGPRERTAEELERARHGGFRSFSSGPRDGDRRGFTGSDESGTARWSSSRASDDQRRNGGFGRDSDSSRADEVDDWGASKKFTTANSFDRRDRGAFFESHSRADESDSWVFNKRGINSPESRRRGGFDMLREPSNAADLSDSWGRRRDSLNNTVDSSDSWTRKKEETSGRPRLILQPRTIGEANQAPAKSKGPNPFGAARPREEVLAEKGQDWKKIEEQLESVRIKEMMTNDPPSGKKSFGSGNGTSNFPDDKSWRKNDSSLDAEVGAEKVNERVAAS